MEFLWTAKIGISRQVIVKITISNKKRCQKER